MLPTIWAGLISFFNGIRGKKTSSPDWELNPSCFGVEELEERRFKSVTVTEGYTGFYDIQGDDSDNAINVAVSQTNQTFTLDGVTYSDVQYIQVEGNGGNDTISVTADDNTDDNQIGAAISGGAGDDVLTLNFSGGIWGGDGNDIIHLTDSYYGVAHGEGGDDQIYVAGASVSADIDGGDGNDVIDCSANGAPVDAHGGAGDDTIYGSNFDDQLYGDGGTNVVVGGTGNDMLYAQNDSHDTIDGGDGNGDVLYGNGSEDSISNVECYG
jgi:RTX calcium-binding nonapeptide repeat (4 copies)